jgi:hypothetical protein
MCPTTRKLLHKVTASSNEEYDVCRPGARVKVWPRAHTKIKRNVKVKEEKECTTNMPGSGLGWMSFKR